jgi:hypothetical protein
MLNSLIARINNTDYEIVGGNIKYNLDKANTFDVQIRAAEIEWQTLHGTDIEVYENGELIISGFVDKRPKLKIKTGQTIVASIKCLDELGRLTLERAKSTAHYQDQQIVAIISDLFTSVGATWTLSLVNMIDPLITTTIDVRNKETLFAQISEAIRSVPNLHMRYGGIDISGDYILEIGDFGDVVDEAVQDSNLISISPRFNTEKVYKTIESFGDLTNTTRISLLDALSDPRTILHPDYAQFPISQDPVTLVWICTNTAVVNGANVRKSLNVIKTKNDSPPTVTEIAEAGYALWLKTVRLMKSAIDYETYSGQYISQIIPGVGDKLKVKSDIYEPVYDAFSGFAKTKHKTFSVDGELRLTDVSYGLERLEENDANSFEQTTKRIVDFEVVSIDDKENIDPDLELYERLERFNNFDNLSDSVQFYPVQVTTVTWDWSHAADCNVAGGPPPPNDGKTFYHNTPVYPHWATQVTTWYTVSDQGQIKQLTEPVNPGDDWEACVQDSVAPWPPAAPGSVTVTVYWFFS